MIRLDPVHRKRSASFFKDYQWNYLPEAIIEGFVGQVMVDNQNKPSFAILAIPKLKLFIPGGNADHLDAQDFIADLPEHATLFFASDGWETLIKELYPGRFAQIQRYAFTSENLDQNYLAELITHLPSGYQLKQIDLGLARQLAAEKSEFASDHLLNFDSPADFIKRGFGFCILDGNQIISAATTFVVCSKGIEIQINTREEYRRQGLATVVAAQLMLHSLQNGLNPNWDAANKNSGWLAQKLGYTPQGTYKMWYLLDSAL